MLNIIGTKKHMTNIADERKLIHYRKIKKNKYKLSIDRHEKLLIQLQKRIEDLENTIPA